MNKEEINQYYDNFLDYSSLSDTDKDRFLTERGLYNRSYSDITRIYKNTKFREAFSQDPNYDNLKSLPSSYRDEMLQQYAANKTREKFFTSESIGEDKANQVMGLTPQGLEDLIRSDWDPDNYISAPSIAETAAIGAVAGGMIGSIFGGIGAVPGAATGTKLGSIVGLVGSGIETLWNKDTDSDFNAVVAADNDRKSAIASRSVPQVRDMLNMVMDGSAFKDQRTKKYTSPVLEALKKYGVDPSKGDTSNIDVMFEKVVGGDSPYYKVFKDRAELSDLTKGDKMDMIQRTLATDLVFQDGGYSSLLINNQNIQNHISRNQSWYDWGYNTVKNLIVGTVGTLGETTAGIAALGAYAVDEANGLMGYETHYAKNILEGKDDQGNEMPLLLNLAYFDGVDKFNTFDAELIEQIRENGGISPYNNVVLAGQEGRFFSWQSLNEAIRMGKYAAGTKITSSILGGITGLTSRGVQRSVRAFGAKATTAEAAGTFTNKFGSMGTYLAAGVPVSAGYGLGAYEDVKLNLTEKEDKRQAQDLFEKYKGSEEYRNKVAEVERKLLTPTVDENGTIRNLYTKESAKEAATAQVESEAAQFFSNYVKNNRDALAKSNPEYKINRDNIDKVAVDAFALDATIEGAKNTFVNLNFRTYLFNKSTTQMLKGEQSSFTPVRYNYRTGKIEQTSKGIDGKDVPSNVKKDIARAVGNQLWGGFISNYTDDVTTGFVEAGAEKVYDNYLGQRYNVKSIENCVKFFGDLYGVASASLHGAEAKMVDPMSWYDGFIGALGSLSPGSGGLPTLSPYSDKVVDAASGRSTLSKVLERAARTIGVGATAYDVYHKHQRTSEAVDVLNERLPQMGEDLLDLMEFASVTNAAEHSSENGPVQEAKTNRSKSLLSTLLFLERNKNNPVINAAPQVQNALRITELLRSDKTDSKEYQALVHNLAMDFLSEPTNSDIASLPQEEATARAEEKVQERLDKARKVINSMDEALAEVRIYNKEPSNDALAYMATLKVMADQYDGRIREMEKELGLPEGSSISRELAAEGIVARIPSKKKAEERLRYLKNSIHHVNDWNRFNEGYRHSSINYRYEERKALYRNLLEQLTVEANAIEAALENYYSEDGTPNKVLSRDEILSLDALSRAAMLSTDENSNNYSPEQNQIIRALLRDYTEKGVANARELFSDIYALGNLRKNNLEIYSENLRNSSNLESIERSIKSKQKDFADSSRELRDNYSIKLLNEEASKELSRLEEMGASDEVIYNSMFDLAMKFGAPRHYGIGVTPLIKLITPLHNAITYVNKLESARIDDKVNQVAPKEPVVRRNFLSNIEDIIKRSRSIEQILDNLGRIIDSSEVRDADKIPYEKLLNELEQVWNTESSTTVMTREERQDAIEKYHREQEEENARREAIEEEARREAEKKSPVETFSFSRIDEHGNESTFYEVEVGSRTTDPRDGIVTVTFKGVIHKRARNNNSGRDIELVDGQAFIPMHPNSSTFDFIQSLVNAHIRGEDGHILTKEEFNEASVEEQREAFRNILSGASGKILPFKCHKLLYFPDGRVFAVDKQNKLTIPLTVDPLTKEGNRIREEEVAPLLNSKGTAPINNSVISLNNLGTEAVSEERAEDTDVEERKRYISTTLTIAHNANNSGMHCTDSNLLGPGRLTDELIIGKGGSSNPYYTPIYVKLTEEEKQRIKSVYDDPNFETTDLWNQFGRVVGRVQREVSRGDFHSISGIIKDGRFHEFNQEQITKSSTEESTETSSNDKQQVDNEDTLTEEDIARGVEQAEEIIFDDDVQQESPSIEEQVGQNKDKVSVVPINNEASIEQSNTVVVSGNGTLVGNRAYGYETKPLKNEGTLTPRTGSFFDWMNSFGVKLQEIIDTELSSILKTDPDIYPLRVKIAENATNDVSVQDLTFWAVEYTPKVARIHNDSLGGVVTFNGKQYLMIGTMGYKNDIEGNRDTYISEHDNAKIDANRYFQSNPSERFFVNTSRRTKVLEMYPGYIVKRLPSDSSIEIRTISELLSDPARNPKGLSITDLKWRIQIGNEVADVNVSGRNTVYKLRNAQENSGSAFLLMETANGNYVPIYINPTRYKEIRDGKLKRKLDEIFNNLTSTDYAERLNAWKDLRHYVYCNKEGDWLLLGDKNHSTVTIQKDGVRLRTYDLSSPNFDRSELIRDIQDLDFRINITTSVLLNKSDLEMYDEAGALTTDIAMLGTANADFSVHAIDSNGRPVIKEAVDNTAPSLRESSDLVKSQSRGTSERVGNITYRKDSEGRWITDTRDPVTDPRLIEQLDYRHLIRTQLRTPDKVVGTDKIYIVNSDRNNPLVLIQKSNRYVVPMSKEAALRTIDEVGEEAAERARQERARTEEQTLDNLTEAEINTAVEQAEEVDISLTDEQISAQIIGDFSSKLASQQDTTQKRSEQRETESSSEEAPSEESSSKSKKEPASKPKQPRTREDINKTGNKSLAELQNKKSADTALLILRNRTYGKRAMNLLRSKFPDMPSKTSEIEAFLQSKGIPITGITDVEKWLKLIEECR